MMTAAETESSDSMNADEALLGVEQSLMQARWVMPTVTQDEVEKIARKHDVPEVIARLLAQRGVPAEEVETFLNPRVSRHFPDPFALQGMDSLAAYLADAVAKGRKIGVFGDFDVDGATSTAIMVRFFRHLGLEIPFYIPDRLAEGYGPNVPALEKLKAQGVEIVLICDCGITAFEQIAAGREMGIEIVVLDHHEAEDSLPEANHIINPKRRDDSSGYTMLAACGVAFLTCVAVNTKLRDAGFFKERGLPEAPLKDWMDILALGTVCDMVPLTGPNRLFVRFGFRQMAAMNNPGIKALAQVAGIDSAPEPYHAGFVLGPRINAGSRVHQADLGARLLSTDDAEEARNIAFTLEDCNKKRKDIEMTMVHEAVSRIEQEAQEDRPVIIVGDEGWHPGLSGLVAGRIKEKYGKPACVITYAKGENGILEGRGSGRSVAGVNMGAAFIDARNEGLLVKGGGHAMAAGFTVLQDKIDDFRAFLSGHIEKQLEGQVAAIETTIDAMLSVRGAQIDFVRMIHEQLGPFGQEMPEPLFVLPHVKLHMVDIVGKDHIKALLSDWEGGGRMKAIAFRALDTEMGKAMLEQGSRQPFHLAGHLKVNSWNGRESVEMQIVDAAPAMPAPR